MREWLKGLRVLQNTFFIWIFFRLFLTDELYKILGLGLEQKEVVLSELSNLLCHSLQLTI